jgi:hypothetical protein
MAEKKALLIRISPQLWERLRRLADSELRSLNGQIEFLLSEAVRKRGATSGDSGDRKLAK